MTGSRLFGDGVHDDYPYIQSLLDTRIAQVSLPAPKKNYVITKTLKIHGDQTLLLPEFAVIKLAPGANCSMIEDDDFDTQKQNIAVIGGIWDMDHNEQDPNPYHFPGKDGRDYIARCEEAYGIRLTKETEGTFYKSLTAPMKIYTGNCMRFCRIRNFTLRNVTLRNPVVYGVQLYGIEDFTVENITFDYFEGSPKLWNLDGVHVEGNCKNGYIHNLKGACHDDLVALTSDDVLYGPIENITVDGIYAEHCHSAVRLLSHGIPVKNVHITNVFGTYYVYGIGITKYHGGPEERGTMSNITLDHLNFSLCEGTKDVKGNDCPLIWVQSYLDIDNLRIENITREETWLPNATIGIDEGSVIDGLVVRDLYQVNKTGKPMSAIDVKGTVQNFLKENIIEK